jgi:alpha-L-arabinofuranosidase
MRTRTSLLALAGLLWLSAGGLAQDTNFFIYLCLGQSNMEGAGQIEEQDKAVDNRFQMFSAVDSEKLGRKKGNWYPATPPLCRENTHLSPVDYFGRTMVAHLSANIRVGVVCVAIAGCKIELFEEDAYQSYAATAPGWMTNIIRQYNGNPYQYLVDLARQAQKDGVIKGILLHQGESNTGDRRWPAKVKGIYDNLIKDLNLNPNSVPLLAGELVNADQKGSCASMNRIIATLPQTLPNSYVVSSTGCTCGPDHLHFNSAGYRELGTRYARKMLWVMGQPNTEPAAATIDAAKTGAPISPFIYGQFLEHAGSLIYSSLWSELLDDRKFFYAVTNKPAEDPNAGRGFGGFGPRRRNVGAGRWNPIGPAESVVMDTTNPFVGDHTPEIFLAAAEPRGIRQTGVNFNQGSTYHGRIQLAGDPGAKVSVNIVWGADAGAVRQTIRLGKPGGNYKKFTFSFKAGRSGPAQFEIVGTGAGSFHVGAVSLLPAENLAGWRTDAMAALKSLRSGVYRFPGGNFVSAHEWRDAIGDPDKRPPVYDPVWRAMQPNDIGTDEFMTMCQLLGVEPYVTVNAGTGDANSAAEYVEYCNSEAGTPMGKLRAANGHREPYHVKFWGIGNEAWGYSYQYGAMKLSQFEYKHNQFARAMRRADPTIKLIASGAMPDTMTGSKESLNLGTALIPPYLSPADWTGGLLSNCFNNIDLISEHFYNYGNTHFSLPEGRQVPNNATEPVTDWMRRPANHIRIKFEEYKDYENIFPQLAASPKPMNIDEWAYASRGGGDAYPVYPSYAWVFHEMFRHSDLFQMAAYTFGTSLLTTNQTLNANGLVFKFYRDHFGNLPVEVSGNSPQPRPSDPPGGEQPQINAGSDTFPLDVAAAWTNDRRALTVAIVNPTDVEQPLKLKIAGADLTGKGTLWRLASGDANSQSPAVSSHAMDSIPDSLMLPRFSVSIFELSVAELVTNQIGHAK